MNDVEDRVTSLLTRTAEAIDVELDIDRVLGAPHESDVIPLTSRKPSRRRRVVMAVGAAAVVIVAVVGYTVRGPGRDDVEVDAPATSPGPAPTSSPSGHPARTSSQPRYLVTQDGWQIDDVVDGDSRSETTFSDGVGNRLDLHRRSPDEYAVLFEDRRVGAEDSWRMTIAGQDARVWDSGVTFSAFWRNGDYGFELRGNSFANREDFQAVADTLEQVDETEWLAALPDALVLPDERAAEVDAALAEVPLPTGLDAAGVVSAMDSSIGESDGMQREAIDVVVCAWIQHWSDAKDAGDAGALDEAVSAMSSSREWPVLAREAGGPWTKYIWDVADAMAADQPLELTHGLPQATGYLRHVDCPES